MDRSMLISVLTAIVAIFFIAGCALKQNKNPDPIAKNETGQVIQPVNQETVDVLLIAFDNGEGRAFRAALPALKTQNLSVRVLTFGPADQLFENTSGVFSLSVIAGNQTQSADWQRDRNAVLSENELQKTLQYFKPTIVVTGMAHTIQAQLLDSYRREGSYTIAFYDNFEEPGDKEYVQPWLNTTTGADELFLPATYLNKNFSGLPQFKQTQLTVTGQPVLDEWAQAFRETNRSRLRQKLTLEPERQIVVFAGGYDKSYTEALQRFLEAAKARTDLQFLITPHPRTDGSAENDAVAEMNKTGAETAHIFINRDIPTHQLATVASLMVVHQSTTGFMARAQGLPVLYIAADNYSNPMIDGLQARRAWNWSGILNEMHRLLDQDNVQPPFHNMLPDKPVARFANRIGELYGLLNKGPAQPVLESVEVQ